MFEISQMGAWAAYCRKMVWSCKDELPEGVWERYVKSNSQACFPLEMREFLCLTK
jgi:hypothetical protein